MKFSLNNINFYLVFTGSNINNYLSNLRENSIAMHKEIIKPHKNKNFAQKNYKPIRPNYLQTLKNLRSSIKNKLCNLCSRNRNNYKNKSNNILEFLISQKGINQDSREYAI